MKKKTIATNRKAKFEYFLLDDFEAGLVLQGSEIKSIRARKASIAEAYVQISNNEAWLINSHIAPYDPASRENHDPKRKRKLLLNRREINKIADGLQRKGLTIVPTELYLVDGLAKIRISLAKGKKLHDKRHEIAKKDMKREMQRAYKRR